MTLEQERSINNSAKPWGAEFFASAKAGLLNFGEAVAEHIAEKLYEREFLRLMTLEDCVQFCRDESKNLADASVVMGFALSVRKNSEPKNENDNFVIVQVLVDANKEPVLVNGEVISRELHARAISDDLRRAMDGKEARVFRV